MTGGGEGEANTGTEEKDGTEAETEWVLCHFWSEVVGRLFQLPLV